MRILYITPYLSFPLRHGGRIRTFHLMTPLARRHQVVNVSGHAPDDAPDAEQALEAAGLEVRSAPLAPAFGTLSLAQRMAKIGRLLRGRSSLVPRFATPKLRALVAEEARRADVVVLEMVWTGAFHAEIGDRPYLLSTQNVESDILVDKAHAETGIGGWLARREARALSNFERLLAVGSRSTIAVSEPDAARFHSLAPGTPVHVVENGVDLDRRPMLPPPPMTPLRPFFVGGMDYDPNRDAAFELAEKILPALRRHDPLAEALIVGRDHGNTLARVATLPGVRLLGEIPELDPALAQASAVVVPLRYGGGSRIKILDAWAFGRPVVSTAAGAAGLAAEDGVHYLGAETPEAFVAALLRLRDDDALREDLIRAGRRKVEEGHDWKVLGARFADLVEAVASGRGQAG